MIVKHEIMVKSLTDFKHPNYIVIATNVVTFQTREVPISIYDLCNIVLMR